MSDLDRQLFEPIGPEDDQDLVRRYATDEPDAVAEVRRRRAERQATLCP
jgi:hypothetical protein